MPRQKKKVYQSRVVRRQVKVSGFERFGASKMGVIIASFFILFLSVAIFHTWSHVQVVNVGYSIDKELKLKDDLIQQNKILKLQVAQLRSLERIEELAKKRLGMQVPQKRQMIFLSQLDQLKLNPVPIQVPEEKKLEEKKVLVAKKTVKKIKRPKKLKKTKRKKRLLAKNTRVKKKKSVKKKRVQKVVVNKKKAINKRRKVRTATLIGSAKR